MPADLSQRVADHPFWYHVLDLGDGVVTPGVWDLRPIVDRLPWPDVAGKRCLDIGPFDGFYAFELERRGAAEVVAVDLADPAQLDWPWEVRPGVGETGWDARFGEGGFDPGAGLRLAAEALGSSVRWQAGSIYDLDPDVVGTFDVVTCGSLLLHLRDPVRALEAVRSVCRGHLLSVDAIDVWLTLLQPRRPAARFDGLGNRCQWWITNAAGHHRMLRSAGFEAVRTVRAVPVPNQNLARQRPWRSVLERGAQRLLARGDGVLHHAVLARPRRA
jgi:tRNA (mo5U34)-methyltransferase